MTTVGEVTQSGRVGRRKSRSGCVLCKKKRLKCDEQEPSCGRCRRAGAPCDYAFTKLRPTRPGGNYRQLVPAGAGGQPLRRISAAPSVFSDDVPSVDMFYIDNFRTRIAASLVLGGYSEPFWHRTVLRETLQDPIVRDATAAVGALDCARQRYAFRRIGVPLFTLTNGGHDNSHAIEKMEPEHVQALRYYARAISALRTRLADGGTPPYRTMLIATCIFLLFETLQGNTDAVNRLFSSSILALKDQLLSLTTHQTTGFLLAARIDDGGVEDAEFFLPRIASLRGLSSPLHPVYPLGASGIAYSPFDPSKAAVPDVRYSHADIIRYWDRFYALVATWYIRSYRAVVIGTLPAHHTLQAEQATIAVLCKEWMDVFREKQKLEPAESSNTQKQGLILMSLAARVATLLSQTVLDSTELIWDRMAPECLGILIELETLLGSTPIFRVKRLVEDQLLPTVNCFVAKCRDTTVRQKGRALFRQVTQLGSTSWENLNTLAWQHIVCVEEEQGRLGDGSIPISSRLWWVSSNWDAGYTRLVITNRRLGTDMDQYAVLTREEFESLVQGPEPQAEPQRRDYQIALPIRSQALA